ncbi:hypothetical protein C7N43_30515 [Sphingobacteriales bacterium UPWRP_1]|nr:hypothetical protein BVG80_15930 [Sphingobacteriales bacterium TSM_CSM]PSJ73169.1 hypothetical protein C7N43_30515 [Sphingobacteriales bacterium UPWRP_1]
MLRSTGFNRPLKPCLFCGGCNGCGLCPYACYKQHYTCSFWVAGQYKARYFWCVKQILFTLNF